MNFSVDLLCIAFFCIFASVINGKIDTWTSSKAFVNLALRRPAYQKTTYADDTGGNSDSQWWVVDLGETRRVAMVILYERGECCANGGMTIGVGNDFTNPTFNPQAFQTCGSTGLWVSGGINRIVCTNGTLFGRYISVYITSADQALIICELEAYSFVFENVAVGRPSYMSGTVHSGSPVSFNPQLGNDGKGGAVAYSGTYCTLAADHPDPWWLVDLEEKRTVTRVVIQTRADCCADVFKDFTVAVGNNFDSSNLANFVPSSFSACATVPGYLPQGGVYDLICDPPVEGRYLTIHQTGSTSSAQFCEVLVYDHPVFNLDLANTTTHFKKGSTYKDSANMLMDSDENSCISIPPTTSRLDQFQLKTFSYNLCLNGSKFSVVTENLQCNQLFIYDKLGSIALICDFTGLFKMYDVETRAENGMRFECWYNVGGNNSTTCDFVYIVIPRVTNSGVKVCEINFRN